MRAMNAPTKTYDPVPARRVAFLGLGVMGYPMAGHLARAGHQVTVYNRTAAKAEAWAREYGGAHAPTPAQAAAIQASLNQAPGQLNYLSGLFGPYPFDSTGAVADRIRSIDISR